MDFPGGSIYMTYVRTYIYAVLCSYRHIPGTSSAALFLRNILCPFSGVILESADGLD